MEIEKDKNTQFLEKISGKGSRAGQDCAGPAAIY